MKDPKEDDVTGNDNINIDEVIGYAFLLILTSPASTTITHWGKFDSQSNMLLQLSQNLKIPSIIKDPSNKPSIPSINIGNLNLPPPKKDTWLLACAVAKDLEAAACDLSFGLLVRLHAKIIHSKCIMATRMKRIKKHTITATAGSI